MIDSATALDVIRNSGTKFFSVSFRRKRDRRVRGVLVAAAGSVRDMLCRARVRRYTKGVVPPPVRAAEDRRNEVLTVWDVEAFHRARQRGLGRVAAGRAAYRRINLAEVLCLSPVP
jgi:hypothetical protein